MTIKDKLKFGYLVLSKSCERLKEQQNQFRVTVKNRQKIALKEKKKFLCLHIKI